MKFKAPEGASSVTYLGKEHDVDDDGLVELPADAHEHIAPHGFKPHVPKKAADVPEQLKPKKAADVLKAIAAADPAMTLEQLKGLCDFESGSKKPREDVLAALDGLIEKAGG